MNAEITKPRREKLASAMEAGQMAVVFARMEQEGIEKFTQDNNFLYFTGLMVPDAAFCLLKTKDKTLEYLFIQRGIPEREVWDGKKLTVEEARQISGIQTVSYLDEFYTAISGFCPLVSKIWSNIGNPMINRPLSYPMFMLQPIRNIYSNISIENLNNVVRPIRSVKSDWEIAQMQKAMDATGLGIAKVMEKTKAGMMEYELEAKLFYQMQKNGVQNWGFAPIIATGANATTLHYKQNNCEVGANDVVLMDVGASWMNYSADITRCFPVSGEFSPRQKQVYEEVLAIQKAIIEMVRPGVGLLQLNERTVELTQEALIRLGLIQDKEHYRRYYMHSVSHHLGMDTHDLGARDSILEVGNVITVEPGIYIPEESLGIRIEDDILVTESGYRNLSTGIPKEVEELESIRQEALK
jgi:Xaa-Pro aminopeptidase